MAAARSRITNDRAYDTLTAPGPLCGPTDRWYEELLPLAGEDLLRRFGEDVKIRECEAEYKGHHIYIQDDDRGWTYRYGWLETRNLEDVLMCIEDELRESH